jgi:hypothetical protein
MADVAEPGFQKYWRQELSTLKSQCYAMTNKYPEAASVVQQAHKIISNTEALAKRRLARVGKSSLWTFIHSFMFINPIDQITLMQDMSFDIIKLAKIQ